MSGPAPSASRFDRQVLRKHVSATLGLLVLAVGIPLYVVDWSSSASSLTNVALAYLIVLSSSCRLTQAIATGSIGLFRAFFYLFVYIFMGLAPLAQIVAGAFPLDNRSYPDSTVTIGFLTVLLGIVGYELGWFVYTRRTRGRAAAVAVPTRWAFSPRRTVLLGLAGLAVVGFQVASYGLTTFFVSRAQTAYALAGQDIDSAQQPLYNVEGKALGALTTISSQTLVLVALFVILYSRRFTLWPRPASLLADLGWRGFIVVLAGANLVMNNPIGNSRVWFCLVLVAFFAIYVSYNRPSAVRRYVLLALFTLVFLFASFDAYRVADSGTSAADELTGPRASFVQDGTYAMFQMQLTGLEYVAAQGHTDGYQMAGALLVFVPRAIWPDKPNATGQLIDPPLLRSTTAWTEFSVDFGTVGILVGFVLLGVASAWFTRRSAGASPGLLHALVPLAAVFQIFLLRGSLLPAMGIVYQMTAVFVLVLLPLRAVVTRSGPEEPEPPDDVGSPPVVAAGRTVR